MMIRQTLSMEPRLGRPPSLRCGPASAEDEGSPQRAPKESSTPSRHADSPASSWVVTPISADEVPPPLGPLTLVSATLVRGSKRKIHLLNQDLRAVGCGWSPSMEKVEALNAIDYQNDIVSFALCVRCFHQFSCRRSSRRGE